MHVFGVVALASFISNLQRFLQLSISSLTMEGFDEEIESILYIAREISGYLTPMSCVSSADSRGSVQDPPFEGQ